VILTRLTETPEYVKQREELRPAEIDLMRHRERVAGQRQARRGAHAPAWPPGIRARGDE
jgi:predicted dithiol-disulfide oxidoreductase (DUF899 family)